MEKGYNLREVALLLGIKIRTVRYWVKIGRIKAKKIANSNRWVVMESEVKRLLRMGEDE